MQEHLLFNYGTKPFFGAGQLWVYRDNIVFKNIVIYFYCACQISRNSPSEVLSEPPEILALLVYARYTGGTLPNKKSALNLKNTKTRAKQQRKLPLEAKPHPSPNPPTLPALSPSLISETQLSNHRALLPIAKYDEDLQSPFPDHHLSLNSILAVQQLTRFPMIVSSIDDSF